MQNKQEAESPRKRRRIITKEPAITLDSAQTALKPFYQAYKDDLLTAEKLIEQLSSYKTYFHHLEFIALFVPRQSISLNSLFKKFNDLEQDLFFKWVLSEVESCISQYPTSLTAFNLIVIKALCCNEAHFKATFACPQIRAVLQNHYARELIQYCLVEWEYAANRLTFLEHYFPNWLMDFKTEIADKLHITLLDELIPMGANYILPLWDQGFRPANQHTFNVNLFAEYKKYPEILLLYDKIAADQRYHAMLQFDPPTDPALVFFRNKQINFDLCNRLAQSVGVELRLNTILRNKNTVFSEKLLGIASQSSTDSLLGEQLLPQSDEYYVNNNPSLLPSQNVANMLWLTAIKTLAYSRSKKTVFKQLESLFKLLKNKGINQRDLFKTTCYVLYGSLSKFLLFKKMEYGIVEWRVPHVPEVLSLMAADMSVSELQEVVSPFINAATNALEAQSEENDRSFFLKKRDAAVQFVRILVQPQKTENLDDPLLFANLGYLISKLLLIPDQENGYAHKLMQNPNELSSLGLFVGHPWYAAAFSSYLASISDYWILTPDIIDIYTKMVPEWVTHLNVGLKEIPYNILSILLCSFNTEDKEMDAKRTETIIHILKLMTGKINTPVPVTFLNEVANWQYNIPRRAKLIDEQKAYLEAIFNQCIHTVQGGAQEKIFEDIRLELLLKFDADPTKDPQAIHTRENHERADEIHATWFNALEGSELEKEQIIKSSLEALLNRFKAHQKKKFDELTQSMDREKAIQNLYDILIENKWTSDAHEVICYRHVEHYINQRWNLAQLPIENLKQEEVRAIGDAKKLCQVLALIMYYSEHSAPEGYNITDGVEALNIVYLELKAQIDNPSCDQGPYIRLLIALEHVAQFKFPYLTRISIHFYVKTYINEYFEHLAVENQAKLIQELYEKIESSATLSSIDFLPENSFSFLNELFLDQYKKRLGYVSLGEISYSFRMERPGTMHPSIVKALNVYHQKQINQKIMKPEPNPHGFFEGAPNREDDDVLRPGSESLQRGIT